MEKWSRLINRFTQWIGRRIQWISTLLVVLIFVDVLLRYFFASPKTWRIELEWHLFALIFLLGAAYGLSEDKHVRVDVFYTNWNARRKAWVNLLGTLLFLIPWCLIIIATSWHYAEHSWALRETSPDPGGLPARYIIKFAITAGFLLLLLQATAIVAACIRTLTNKAP